MATLKSTEDSPVAGLEQAESSYRSEEEKIQAVLEDALSAVSLNSEKPEKEEPVPSTSTDIDNSHSVDEGRPDGVALKKTLRKIKWVDITDKFTQLTDKLLVGELVQEPEFSLFDAMSAIELMDSKMDAGIQCRPFRNYPRTLEDAVVRGMLKCDGHSPEELVGIMDEMLSCIATWLEGHTLAQTVFTSMYLLDVDKVENIYLKSFLLAIVKTVEYMRTCICQGRVFAEDDQQGVSHGLNMLNHVSELTINASLKQAEEQLQVLLKHASSTTGARNSDAHDVLGRSSIHSWKILHLRIRFVKNLFAFVTAMGKSTSQGMEAGLAKLTLSASLMEEMKETIEVGIALDGENPLALGFHPVINQHLLPPSYKPYGILPRPLSFNILLEVLLQIKSIIGYGKLGSFRELFHTVKEFSLASKCPPNVLVRSLLVLIGLQGNRKKLFGSHSLEELLREDVKNFVLPPSLNPRSPVSTSAQAKEATERFLGQSVIATVEFLRVFCQHRARQRYKIVRCLEILGEYQQETQRIDELLHLLSSKIDPQRLHSSCFSTWALYYILQMMVEFVCLGFEFDLYSPFEIHYVYWYLEFLYGWHETCVKSADRLHQVETQLWGKGKRKAAKRSKPQYAKEKERECSVVRMKRLVCVGLMRAVEGLLIDKRIMIPSFEQGSIKLCFHNRFAPFTALLTPQMLTYADYKKLASIDNYKDSDLNLYEAAAKHFQSAKVALESLNHRGDDMDSLLKVIKTNIVVMNLTAKGHKRDSKNPPVFDYSVHKHFPIIRLD